ncbi:MAG: hypothetical protein P3W94_001200 [Paracoccus sp. (in: a-proteobacteria)]|nr:hypothetical protein [Paracoccus sp. (in: a-proteobacteria)]
MRSKVLGQGQISVLAVRDVHAPGDNPVRQWTLFRALRLPTLLRHLPPPVTLAIGTGTDPAAPGLDRRRAPGAVMPEFRPEQRPPDCDGAICRALIGRRLDPFLRGIRSLLAWRLRLDHPATTHAPTVRPARPI